jgi:ATP-dependent Clp protease protease subunit
MGAVLLAAGAEGKRYALPHSRVMIHQPLGGASGQASDIEIQAQEILKIKKLLNGLLAKHTKKSVVDIEKDSDRDKFFSAKESEDYGLIDTVVEKHSETQPEKDKK